MTQKTSPPSASRRKSNRSYFESFPHAKVKVSARGPSRVKDALRHRFLDFVGEAVPCPSEVFLLVSDSGRDAELLHDRWPDCHVETVEASRCVWENIVLPYVNRQPRPMTIREYIDAGVFPKFDAAWLDYCGPLTPLRLREIVDFAAQTLVSGPTVLGITLLQEEDAHKPVLERLWATQRPATGSADTVAGLLAAEVSAATGRRCRSVLAEGYQADPDRGTDPMYFLVVWLDAVAQETALAA